MTSAISEGAQHLHLPQLCGSLSQYPVAMGAAMHNAGYRALGLPWHYIPFEVKDLRAAVSAVRTLSVRGVGVSMPFKLEIIPQLDQLDQLAQRIGAVNTVVNEEGVLHGHNTDWVGAVRAIEETRPLKGARVLLLGAGGAARAVAHGVMDRGAELVVCNRNDERATKLAASLGASSLPYRARNELTAFDVLINASSRGMSDVDPTSPVDHDALGEGLVVLDAVYKPLETELLRAARSAGALPIDGSRMLLHQAAAQFELYTKRSAPLDAMNGALAHYLG